MVQEFWEEAFKEKKEMWGAEPSVSVQKALELFQKNGFKDILIPGFGYGRNAKVFLNNGISVTGIEISETAIQIAKNNISEDITIFHGSVGEMPFDKSVYDGVYCFSLLHLLNTNERLKLIRDCYSQLKPGGIMIFITLSCNDFRFGQGIESSKNTFKTDHGVSLYFYDIKSIDREFGEYGLLETNEIIESAKNKPNQTFMEIICRK